MNFWTESNDNIFVAAHRGWSENYPENTMLAFEKALELGVDQIETDVRFTSDGVAVLMHDARVDRTTDGTGAVGEKTFEEIRALDAGVKKGFPGQRVPTLRELMELVKNHPTITLDVELKEYPAPGDEKPAFDKCGRVVEIIEEYGFADRIVFNSFNSTLNQYIHETYGGRYRQHVYFPIHTMTGATVDPYSYAFCCCMFPTYYHGCGMAEKADFDRMKELGVEPWAGAAVSTRERVREAIRRGAVLITCNNPDEVLSFLRTEGKHR